MMGVLGFEVTAPVLTLGVIAGITYGILAAGLVIAFRASRVINFAHGYIGAFGAALLGVAVVQWHIPYWVMLPVAMAAGAGASAATEVVVVRRLKRAPIVMSIVATLAVGQFLFFAYSTINDQASASQLYPQPPGLPEFHIGQLLVTRAYSGMMIMSPIIVIALAAFLRFSNLGLGIRAAVDNPEAARTTGISVNQMSVVAWALAGALASFGAVLVFPTRGFVTADVFGPTLLLRALVPAVLARMNSLPVALGAGVAVGVLEQELLWNYPGSGYVDAALFAVVVAVLAVQPRLGHRETDGGAWKLVAPWRPLPRSLRERWTVRNIGPILGGVALAGALLLAAVVTNATAVTLSTIVCYAMIGFSVGVVTGLSGQISLGQFALAGVGAGVSYWVIDGTGSVLLGFAAAGFTAAAVSTVIGLPALRIRGLMLAVTTLAFAVAAQTWLFEQSWFLGTGRSVPKPDLLGFQVDSGRAYFVFSLVPLIVCAFLVRNLRRSGVGRQLRAVRDNEDGARSFTVPATRVKLKAFALGGFLAGIGGATIAGLVSFVTPDSFPIADSINIVALTALGGIEVLAGPILGALYIIGVPQFLPLDSAGLAASSLGWLAVIIYFPGGLVQAARPVRDWLIRRLAGADGSLLDESADQVAAAALTRQPFLPAVAERVERGAVQRPTDPQSLLVVAGVAKRFGGRQALDGVSFSVSRGEVVGLIGPNGAGKTTLFDLISGFVRPDAGEILFDGLDVSRLRPEQRAQIGLIRSFQDAALFPTMTALDAVQLAFERHHPSRLLPSVLGLSARPERLKEAHARELLAVMGLSQYEDRLVGELSTGTRRILEIACLVALRPTLLLLDEPSSGIAQRETEALGGVLRRVKEYLDTTLIVVEHDMPLIMELSDRLVAMNAGSVIAIGTPDEVKADPVVVESYLGGNVLAVNRSGELDCSAKLVVP